MSGPPPGGYNPNEPPPGNEGKLANYFGSPEVSTDNPFAFATNVSTANNQAVNSPFDQLQGPGFIHAPPTGPPENPPVHGHMPHPPQRHEGMSHMFMPTKMLMRPPSGEQFPPPNVVPMTQAPFVPQTGQPPVEITRDTYTYHSNNHYVHQEYPNVIHEAPVNIPPSIGHAATLPFTGQQVSNSSDNSGTGHLPVNDVTQDSLLIPRVLTNIGHDNVQSNETNPLSDTTSREDQLTNQIKEMSLVGVQDPPTQHVSSLPRAILTQQSDSLLDPHQQQQWTPLTGPHEPEKLPEPLAVSSHHSINEGMKILPNTVPLAREHSDDNNPVQDSNELAVRSPDIQLEHNDPGFDKPLTQTSLTGSNASTGTNTPFPPVLALPFYHSHSVPNNLIGAAEMLTNAHIAHRQSLTNADTHLLDSDGGESKTLPSATNNAEFEHFTTTHTSLPANYHQISNNGFTIGPIHEDVLNNEEANRERAVIEGDSDPPSASQSLSSLNGLGADNSQSMDDTSTQADSVNTLIAPSTNNETPPTTNETVCPPITTLAHVSSSIPSFITTPLSSTANNNLTHPSTIGNSHSFPTKMEEEDRRSPEHAPPDGISLPPSLSVPPTVDLTLGAVPPDPSPLPQQQSLYPFGPPPPVMHPQMSLKRNNSFTNAGTIEQEPRPPVMAPPTSGHAPNVTTQVSTNATVTNTTRSEEGDRNIKGSRSPLSGRERSEYDPYQRDYYKRDERRRDDYYDERYYDRPHSRTAYQLETRDHEYPYDNRQYYGEERRDRHYTSYYDDRDRYWRSKQDYYHDYDQYQYDRYQGDRHSDRYHGDRSHYDDRYYQDYYHGGHYDGYPPDRSRSRQRYYDNTTLADESSIYGHHDSYVDSPGNHFQHGGYSESTRIEQPDYNEYDNYGGHGDYPPGERYPIEGYRQEEDASFRPIQGSPPPPVRETPLPFAHPHVSVRFGIGGHLVTVLPVVPTEHSSAIVEIHTLKELVPQAAQLADRTTALPGPLLPGDTSKNAVLQYISRMSDDTMHTSQDPDLSPRDRDMAIDDTLLWRFLFLLCQQNGVLVPSDISELLTKGLDTPISPPRGVGVGGVKETERDEDALQEFRLYLLSGRKKDALELACKRSLWGHALMLSSRMDDQSRTYVVNRFTASLPTTDPLNTFYTMMLGRVPSIVRPEGLGRAGDWKSHLAMIVANNQDKKSITTLGESLLSQGRVYAAHLCFHLSGLQIGSEQCSSYSLLGVKTPSVEGRVFIPGPEELCRTEVFEYALGLTRSDFTLPSFQRHKLLHTIKLFEAGLLEKALRYCESIAYYVTRDICQYNPTFLTILQELSTRLHHASCPLGVMETELPSWIIHLEQSMNESAATDNHTPPPSRDSPSLVSASRLMASQLIPSVQYPPTHTNDPVQEGSGSHTNLSQKYTPVNNVQAVEQEYGYGNETAFNNAQLNTGYTQQPITNAESYNNERISTGGDYQMGGVDHQMGGVNHQMGGVDYQMGGVHHQVDHQMAGVNLQMGGLDHPTVGNDYQMGGVNHQMGGVNHQMGGVNYQVDHQMGGVNLQMGGLDHPTVGNDYQMGGVNHQMGGVNHQVAEGDYRTSGHSIDHVDNTAMTSNVPETQHNTNEDKPTTDNNPWLGYSGQQYNEGYSVTNTATGPLDNYNYDASTHVQGGLDQQWNRPSSAGFSYDRAQATPTMDPKDSNPPPVAEQDNEGSGEEEKTDNRKEPGNDNQGQSGWLGGILSWIPKGQKRAHLPKDKDKRIVFDKEKNKWVNLDGDESEDSVPTAPPTDNELMKQKPAAGGINQTDGVSTGPPASNQYSRTRLGKVGARSMYVDVLSQGGAKRTTPSGPAGAPPPSLIPPMMSSLPPMKMNPGAFFTGSSNVPATSVADNNQYNTVNEPLHNQIKPDESHTTNAATTHPPLSHHPVQHNNMVSERSPRSARSSTSIEFESEEIKQDKPAAPQQPQFFNPSAFSSVNQMPGQQLPPQRKDPFPDNVSEVSEYSVEVSRINRQVSSRSMRPRYPANVPINQQYPPAHTTTTGPPAGVRPPAGGGGWPRPPPGGNWL